MAHPFLTDPQVAGDLGHAPPAVGEAHHFQPVAGPGSDPRLVGAPRQFSLLLVAQLHSVQGSLPPSPPFCPSVPRTCLAVDLCKLALWLEGHTPGKPLSFLDHRIQCGNSLVGVPLPRQVDAACKALDARHDELMHPEVRQSMPPKEWKAEVEKTKYIGWPSWSRTFPTLSLPTISFASPDVAWRTLRH